MLEYGKVAFDRKIVSWRWYHDSNTFKLFFHLIITANYKDVNFENTTVKRGQRISSVAKLSQETGLSERSVRTALNHLKVTGEVTSASTPKYTVFTIVNYDKYQMATNKVTNNRLTDDQLTTNKRQQCNKDNKENKENKYNAPSGAKKSGLGRGGGHTDF